MTIQAIETHYAGHRFRSRLEARWAVFFDELCIAWEYEPQGFVIGDTPYLPDFLLTECGTWVEVKGNPDQLDIRLMNQAALSLPEMPHLFEPGPRLMILGPIPKPSSGGDWGWLGLSPYRHDPLGPDDGQPEIESRDYGFGLFRKNRRPWILLGTSSATAYDSGSPADWLIPSQDPYEDCPIEAYRAACSARFEHGERG